MSEQKRCLRCGTPLREGEVTNGVCAACAEPTSEAGETRPFPEELARRRPENAGAADGAQIGPYRLLTRIGAGGMGEVWEAEQRAPVRRTVALKLMRPGLGGERFVARFEAERQALALMDHPHIARVYDAGTTSDHRPYLVMELVAGTPITEYCDRRRLSTAERLELFVKVCEAVHHAHQKAILHRDLKPSNILVTEVDGTPLPKIIDFGVAKAIAQPLTERTMFTELGQVIGTPEYMSPEQAEMSAAGVDIRSDVYSLGVLLYELLTGFLPFDARELRDAGLPEIVRRLREEDPPRPSVRLSSVGERGTEQAQRRGTEPGVLVRRLRGDLDWIVMKALEKDRARRYGTAAELALDIGRSLRDEPVLAGPPSTVYRARKFVRRHRVAVLAGAVVVAALVAGAAAAAIGLVRATRAEALARTEAETAQQVSDFLVELFGTADPTATLGETITAREIVDLGAERVRSELDEQPRVQARLLDTIGRVYLSLGLYRSAVPLFEEALELWERTAGPASPESIDTLEGLARARLQLSELEEAEELARRALERREAAMGSEHPATAASRALLGSVLLDRGRLEEAAGELERALEIREKTLGGEHEAVGENLSTLGKVLHAQGRDDEARPLLERALAIQERALGAAHPTVAQTLAILARVQQHLGDELVADDAVDRTWERALEIRERVYGPDHPLVAETLNAMAIARFQSEGPEAAERLFTRALEIRERRLGRDHVGVAESLNNLGFLHVTQKEYAAARAPLERALEIYRAQLGPEHSGVARAETNLGSVLVQLGELEAAREHLERGLQVRERTLGAEHTDVANSWIELAKLHRAADEKAAAGAALERAAAIIERNRARGLSVDYLQAELDGVAKDL